MSEYCKHCGSPIGRGVRKSNRNLEIYFLREDGGLFKDIAKKFGISPGRVGYIYRKELRRIEAKVTVYIGD